MPEPDRAEILRILHTEQPMLKVVITGLIPKAWRRVEGRPGGTVIINKFDTSTLLVKVARELLGQPDQSGRQPIDPALAAGHDPKKRSEEDGKDAGQ